ILCGQCCELPVVPIDRAETEWVEECHTPEADREFSLNKPENAVVQVTTTTSTTTLPPTGIVQG
ncbi:MAG TPA: hypothetical protein VM165_08305, partial [Planctomycetaceae bacterium]|nr:hypothetical protein [Planctomycetaceae bacterium]